MSAHEFLPAESVKGALGLNDEEISRMIMNQVQEKVKGDLEKKLRGEGKEVEQYLLTIADAIKNNCPQNVQGLCSVVRSEIIETSKAFFYQIAEVEGMVPSAPSGEGLWTDGVFTVPKDNTPSTRLDRVISETGHIVTKLQGGGGKRRRRKSRKTRKRKYRKKR